MDKAAYKTSNVSWLYLDRRAWLGRAKLSSYPTFAVLGIFRFRFKKKSAQHFFKDFLSMVYLILVGLAVWFPFSRV